MDLRVQNRFDALRLVQITARCRVHGGQDGAAFAMDRAPDNTILLHVTW